MDPLLIALIAVAGLLALPVFWCLVCLLLSRISGWHRLSEQYGTDQAPLGRSLSMQSGWVGIVSYRNCLSVHVAPSGLFLSVMFLLRIGHRPLLIPWSAIHGVEPRQLLWMKLSRFQVGHPPIARIELPAGIVEAKRAATP